MQYWANLLSGTKIEMLSLAKRANEETKIYISKIETTKNLREIEVAMPIDKGRLMPLPEGSRYLVTFYTAVGMVEGECVIKSRYSSEGRYYLLLWLNSKLIKKQRREFYRLDCCQDVEFRVISDKEAAAREMLRMDNFTDAKEKERCVEYILDMEENACWLPAVMLDISGGGLRAQAGLVYGLDKHLMFHIQLPVDNDTVRDLKLECMPVSISEDPKEYGTVQIRCKFVYISHLKQETIVKYIYDEQIKMRARH